MEVQFVNRPGNTIAKVQLGPNESIVSEAGSMISMTGDTAVTTTTHQRGGGGIIKGLKRMIVRESFFLNHYTAAGNGGEILLSPTLEGDMEVVNASPDTPIVIEAGSFVAADPSAQIDIGWQGFKSILSGEGLFWLKTSGAGQVIVNSFGAIYEVAINGDYVIDTGHIVAFESTLDFKITKVANSWLGSFFSGEGFVCRFEGQGKVWCQSHSPNGFGRTLGPTLKPRKVN